jgi:hypothetical protein
MLYVVTLATLAMAGWVTWKLINPLRQPTNDIESWLLEQTPLASSKSEVLRFVESKGWKHNPGARDGDLFWLYLNGGGIGESAICGTLGEYQGWPWWVTVRAIWVFDPEKKLTDVRVFKHMDSP